LYQQLADAAAQRARRRKIPVTTYAKSPSARIPKKMRPVEARLKRETE
jgi:hypothetical protein